MNSYPIFAASFACLLGTTHFSASLRAQPPSFGPGANPLVPLVTDVKPNTNAPTALDPVRRAQRQPLEARLQLATVPAQAPATMAAAADALTTATAAAALPADTKVLRLDPTGLLERVHLAVGQATPVQVTLRYLPLHAGRAVLVHPLDSGTVNGKAGAQKLTLNADGSLALAFQCEGLPGAYSVVVRLDEVETALTFVVPAGPRRDHSLSALGVHAAAN